MIIYHLPPIKGTRKLLWFTTYPLGLFNNDVPRVDRSGVTEKLRRGMSQLSSVAGLLRPARGLKTSFEQWEKTPWFYERGWKSYPLICRVYIRKICFWKGWWISFTKLYIYICIINFIEWNLVLFISSLASRCIWVLSEDQNRSQVERRTRGTLRTQSARFVFLSISPYITWIPMGTMNR